MVASFIKRLARLSLSAPPAGIVTVIPFIYNLLKLHPGCMMMIHRPAGTEEDEDDADDVKKGTSCSLSPASADHPCRPLPLNREGSSQDIRNRVVAVGALDASLALLRFGVRPCQDLPGGDEQAVLCYGGLSGSLLRYCESHLDAYGAALTGSTDARDGGDEEDP